MAGRMMVCAGMFSIGTALAVATGGIASAASPPDVVGQKYGDAQSAISSAGLLPVISTTVGDQKTRADCIVSNTVPRTVPAPENSSGSATSQLLISLDCDAAAASATSPGYSAASVEGKALKAQAAAAATQKAAG